LRFEDILLLDVLTFSFYQAVLVRVGLKNYLLRHRLCNISDICLSLSLWFATSFIIQKTSKMKQLMCVLFIVSVSAGVFAQKEQTLFNGRGLRWTGVWGGPTFSGTLLNEQPTAILGSHVGIELNKNWLLGFSWQRTDNNVRIDELNNDKFTLDSRGLYLGYRPWSYRTIHPTLAISGHRALLGLTENNTSDRVYTAQPEVGLEINVTRWFRLGLKGGYRFMLDTNLPGYSDEAFSGPMGEIGLHFGWSWGRSNTNNSCQNSSAPAKAPKPYNRSL
jgi:hypothetical protein